MNRQFTNTQLTVVSPVRAINRSLIGLLVITAFLSTVSCSGHNPSSMKLNVDPDLGQAVFANPEDAANAFATAIEENDKEKLGMILGADYRVVLPLGDIDSEDADNYISAWKKYHTLIPQGDHKRLIAVGEEKWTLPIPVVEGDSGWYFDIEEGQERIRIRRIGRNELAAMKAVLAYYDAQMEYASEDRDDDGKLEYARLLVSTPETHDGLFWQVGQDEKLSPLGPLLADRSPGGGYHGYYYRILEAQGKHAKGGAYSYLMGDRMSAGFALIAWPVEYGETGVMSFLVSHEGIVYEKDLGPDTARIAEQMQVFDPGPGWNPAKEVNAPADNVEQ